MAWIPLVISVVSSIAASQQKGGKGGGGGMLGGLFGGGGDSGGAGDAAAAMPYLDEIEGKMTPFYSPYIDTGRRANATLEDQFGRLLKDPAAMQQFMGQGFQESPGYQYNVDEATKAANNAAAASGMAGSPAEQAALADTVHGISNQDYHQYLQNNMGLYNTGLQGTEQQNQLGFNASNELAQSLGNMLLTKAKLAYSGSSGGGDDDGFGDPFGLRERVGLGGSGHGGFRPFKALDPMGFKK